MQYTFESLFYIILLIFTLTRHLKACSSTSYQAEKLCHNEKMSLNGIFEWKINKENGVNYVISKPDVCWWNDQIVLRQCDYDRGEWSPKQVQCRKFLSKNIKCPDDLIEFRMDNGKFVCLKISSKEHNFDERFCYGSNFIMGYNIDTIDSEIFKFIFNEYKITSFWLPVKRYEENEFNPFVIQLPGKKWNELYWESLSNVNGQMVSNKHCIAAYMQKGEVRKQNRVAMKIKITHCREFHYSVCVFQSPFVARSGCPQDFGALSHRPNECYGITWDGQKYPDDFRMLKVTDYFKNINTIKIIFSEFDIKNDEYVELEGGTQIPNGKWALRPKNNEMKIVSSKNKIHGLCVEHIESRKNVEMTLRMDTALESLILTVYNKYYIWSNDKPENSIHCFTNAGYGELSNVKLEKIWENSAQTKTVFELKIKSDDPGQYWCEAHTIFNFTHVLSQKIVAAKANKGHAFAMQIEFPLEGNHFPITFTPEQMQQIATCIKNNLKNKSKTHSNLDDLVIHNVRIMDILFIHPNATYLRCVCHTTVSIKSSTVDTSKEVNSDEDNSHENEDGIRHDTAVRMRARDLLIHLVKEFQPRFVHTVRSTEFCFPENEWMLARMGQSATKSKFCLQNNDFPITRKCLGDFVGGAYWEELTSDGCINVTKPYLITQSLYSMDKTKTSKNQPEKAIRDIRQLLELNLQNLIPADFYYLAKIISNSIQAIVEVPLSTSTQPTLPLDTLKSYFPQQFWSSQNISETAVEIVRIFNYLLEVNDSIIRPSIALNSTNILLDAFENLIDHMSSLEIFESNVSSVSNQNLTLGNLTDSEDDKEIDIIEYLDVGVVAKIATNFVVFIISPQVANVTGIALFRINPNNEVELHDDSILRGAFKNEYYRFILANQSVKELLNEQNILMGTFVPTPLWQRLDEISIMSNKTRRTHRPEPKVVIKIYANDKLFQETNLTSDNFVDGKVISISIPGHDKDLPEVLPLILSTSNTNVSSSKNNSHVQRHKHYCSYWNYQTWASDGVLVLSRSKLNNNTVLCGCTHLTPFAYLIGGSYNNLSVDSDIGVIVKKIHKQALDIITLLGCSLSLFGIMGIFVTAFTFRSWRKKANSKVLLQLSAAIALQMIIFCFVNTEENSYHLISNKIFTSCIAIGACLHYSVLVQFCWMVIIAYLQFKRYVQVFGNTRPRRFFIKSTILGWGLPLIPVACVLAFDSDSYIPHQNESTNPLCYPSGLSFYAGIVLPITMVILANLVIFFIVIYNILKNPTGTIRHTDKSLALSQVRLLVLLFFLLGFTWIFGLLNAMKAGLVFSYLFCLTATLQGFILFVYFVVMDPVTRRMWYTYFIKLCNLKTNFDSSSSIKDTSQSF